MDQKKLKALMRAHKDKRAERSKVEHPLARYNNVGQLVCIACKAAVKPDALWAAHIAYASHKENVIKLREAQLKRKPRSPVTEEPAAKRQRVDEEALAVQQQEREEFLTEQPKKEDASATKVKEVEKKGMELPAGFFDDRGDNALQEIAEEARRMRALQEAERVDEEEERALREWLEMHQDDEEDGFEFQDGEIIDVEEGALGPRSSTPNEIKEDQLEGPAPLLPREAAPVREVDDFSDNVMKQFEEEALNAVEIERNEQRSTLAQLQSVRAQAAKKLKLQSQNQRKQAASMDANMGGDDSDEDVFDWRSKGVFKKEM